MTNRTIRASLVALLTLAMAATAETAVAAELSQRRAATAAPVAVTVSAPAEIPKGTRLYITAKASEPLSALGSIEASADQATWHSTGAKIPIEDGQGATSLLPTEDMYYRIVGEGVESAVWHTTLVAKSGYAITAGTRVAQAHSLEVVYLVGTAVKGGKGAAYRVKVEYKKSDDTWATVQTGTASSAGTFVVAVRMSADRTFRAKIVSSTGTTLATSASFFVDFTSGTSTLEERRAVLAWRLGSATTAVHSISSSDVAASAYTGGATSARYQKFKNGYLVEVTPKSGAAQAWIVEGRHLQGYRDRGAWAGKLGLPERDAKCQLLEGGCVTLFSRGAIYTNKSSMSKGIYVSAGRTPQVETLAAAYSQKGYEEPAWRTSKYNDWIGGDHAWCQVFVAWATYAAGRQGEAPVRKYFPHYVAVMKKSPALIRNPKASDIRAGDILIFDWGLAEPRHTGFAVKASGNYVWTFEGNTTDGTGDPQRGVYARKRSLSRVWAVYHPGEYKATS